MKLALTYDLSFKFRGKCLNQVIKLVYFSGKILLGHLVLTGIPIDQTVIRPQIPVGRGDEGPDGGQGFRKTSDGTIDHGVLPPRIRCPVRRGLYRRGALRRTCGLRTRTGDNEGSGK